MILIIIPTQHNKYYAALPDILHSKWPLIIQIANEPNDSFLMEKKVYWNKTVPVRYAGSDTHTHACTQTWVELSIWKMWRGMWSCFNCNVLIPQEPWAWQQCVRLSSTLPNPPLSTDSVSLSLHTGGRSDNLTLKGDTKNTNSSVVV